VRNSSCAEDLPCIRRIPPVRNLWVGPQRAVFDLASPVGPFFVCHGVRGPGGGVIGEPTFFI
jgi:hypothetical protein